MLLRVKAGLHRYHLGSLNCYLRDLPNLLNSTASSADITLGEKSINGLLYADDLVIFSRSAKGLQNIFLISKMESFCAFADLDVNIDKTKVNNYSFRLENVKSNKYLGLSPYGRNFNLARSRRKNCTQSLYPQYFYTEAKCGVLIVTEKYKRPGSCRISAEKIIKMTTFFV